ncbi:morphogenetic protein [Escherichia coli]|uniref:morphogenetic protein n=1 Tax=Escherichia coli TaxID=562 RepID=UPI001E362E4F|nr:morphogenetic protein [Escherichia coli]MCD9249046.1 morphogenetic protein [Escherichia coli]
MKERGMIFNAEMIRALLSGQKTQTRRPVKFPLIDKDALCELSGNELAGELSSGNYRNSMHGRPGDRIWVRETWAEAGAGAPDLKLYRANYPAHVPSSYENVPAVEEVRWTPSIHMPRSACRILLEITAVRVERLRSITLDDARSEGMGNAMPILEYSRLWNSIYPDKNWQSNPWVWVIEFKRVTGAAE